MSLRVDPRVEVIGDETEREARLLGRVSLADELLRAVILGREGEAELGHGVSVPCVAAAKPGTRAGMDFALAARAQAVLEGVELPAQKSRLLEYARTQDANGDVAGALTSMPDREYRSLDEVGEELAPVQPDRRPEEAVVPRAESGDPPGEEAYVQAMARRDDV